MRIGGAMQYDVCPLCGNYHDDGALVGGVWICLDCADRDEHQEQENE